MSSVPAGYLPERARVRINAAQPYQSGAIVVLSVTYSGQPAYAAYISNGTAWTVIKGGV